MSEIPEDPGDHAADFARRYAEPLDWYCMLRMEELGVPSGQIGASDHEHGIAWCAFNPHEREGGGVATGGRITVDSGVLNPDLMKSLGAEVHEAHARARLRDRLDESIAHEFEEARGGDHEYAVEHAPDTELPISHAARELSRKVRDAARDR